MSDEIWKDIPGYEGLYQISSLGRVKSAERDIWHSTYSYRRIGRIRKPFNTNGYNMLNLSKDGKKKCFQIHRLVALAFIPNPENKPDVNHIDGVKTHNWVENLEWATASENCIHAIKTGLVSKELLIANSKKGADAISIRIKCEDTGELFSSITDAKKSIGVENINPNLKNKQRTHKGRGWLFTEVSEEYYQVHKDDPIDKDLCSKIHSEIRERVGRQGCKIPIYCVERDKLYRTMVEAATDNNVDYTAISKGIMEHRKVKGLTYIRLIDKVVGNNA